MTQSRGSRPWASETLIDDQDPAAHTRGSCTAQLTVLGGAQLGRVFPLPQSDVTIGRSPDVEICVLHPSMSRQHARIRWVPGGDYEIQDLTSRNGTRVDGQRVGQRRLLRTGDRIQLGRVLLQFSVVDQLDRRLHEAEKLEAIGRLSAAVNHDFNNLLTVMNCGLSYLTSLSDDTVMGTQDVRECIDEMLIATRRAADLTSRLGTLVRRTETVERERVDVSDLCREVVLLLRRIMPKNISVECGIKPGLFIDGCRAWIHQLLMNPCINARDAMPEGGVLRIEARRADSGEVEDMTGLEPGAHLVVAISDTGVGIPPESTSQVFNPFFTTKATGAGTGLGLATVARVAREHGGEVNLSSEPGAGTTLRIFLPESTSDQAQNAGRDTIDVDVTELKLSTGARVLLVDDEHAVVRAVTRVLKRDGHSVTQACDGKEALERMTGETRPEVVVMDVDMPVMDGATCFDQLRQIAPEIPVIFVSGHADADLERRLLSAGARSFLHKPLDLGLVSAAIRQALHARPSTH